MLSEVPLTEYFAVCNEVSIVYKLLWILLFNEWHLIEQPLIFLINLMITWFTRYWQGLFGYLLIYVHPIQTTWTQYFQSVTIIYIYILPLNNTNIISCKGQTYIQPCPFTALLSFLLHLVLYCAALIAYWLISLCQYL